MKMFVFVLNGSGSPRTPIGGVICLARATLVFGDNIDMAWQGLSTDKRVPLTQAKEDFSLIRTFEMP